MTANSDELNHPIRSMKLADLGFNWDLLSYLLVKRPKKVLARQEVRGTCAGVNVENESGTMQPDHVHPLISGQNDTASLNSEYCDRNT